MRDIVATIQADQYRLITRESDRPLVIQGGPGTGKTAVGLHRASWVIYTEREKKHIEAREVIGDNHIAKVSVVGIGMRSHVGLASKMFKALAGEGINIQMISTSEIKIAVVIDEKYLELAVRVLHKAFGLENAPAQPV